MKIKNLLLVLIVLLAIALRFYKLDTYPALNADEAAIGYNVYSLLETGKDEHGNSWPVHLQSFNDYKPGLYFYLILPFIKVLGLNEWAVRIPGAALGVLTVFVIYLLAKQFSNKKYFPEISALLLAISPWHIHFSRGGWEVNAATFFITTGILLLLKARDNKNWYLPSILVFAASLYTYHSARIIVPILVFGILLLNLKEAKKHFKHLGLAAIVGALILVPLLLDFSRGAVLSRAAGVGLFADSGPLSRINEQRGEHDNFLSIPAKILHNKAVNYSLAFLQNWSEHYWGEFLFLSGDKIQRNKVPETGQLHLIEVIFVLVGIVAILRRPRKWYLVLLWLVIAPFAAALTFQSPHALRAHNMVIPLTLISAYGFTYIINNSKKIIAVAMTAILVLSLARYQHMYWVHMSKEFSFSSQYGVKELVQYLAQTQGKDNKIIVTDRYDQPYILFLFYLKYHPQEFQGKHELTPRDQFGFSTVREFDKYVFKQIDFEGDRVAYPNSLIPS